MISLKAFLKNSSKSSPFGSNLLVTLFTNGLLAFIGLGTGILTARLLGPDGRGELAAIQTWPMLLAAIASLGLPNALVYFSAREPDHAGRWLTTAIFIALITSIPFTIVGYLLIPLLLNHQRTEVIDAARVYLLLLPIQSVVGLLTHPLRGRNDFLTWNLLRIILPLFWVSILLWCVLKSITDPILISRALLISIALLFFPMIYLVVKRIPGSFKFTQAHIAPLLSFGLPLGLSSAPELLNLRLDQMLMAGLFGPRLLGLYVAAVSWSQVVAPVVSALEYVLLPRIAGASQQKQVEYLAEGIQVGLFITFMASAIAAITTPFMIPLLFGGGFAEAVPAAVILCFAAGLFSINRILAAGVMAIARPRAVLKAQIVGLLITAVLLWILLPPFQLVGAAIASFTSYFATSWMLAQTLNRETSLSINNLRLARKNLFIFFISFFHSLPWRKNNNAREPDVD